MKSFRSLMRTAPVILAILLLVVAGGRRGVAAQAQTVTDGSSDEIARVAVVPFTNLSGQPDDEWIGAGIAESLRTDLVGEPSTITVGQDITQATADLLAAGRRLDAARVVGGSYQRVGDRLRVTARFVDVQTGAVISSVRIDGIIDELFSLQDKIAVGLGLTSGTPNDPGSEPGTTTARPGVITAPPTLPPLASAPPEPPPNPPTAIATGDSISRLALAPTAPPPPIPPEVVSRNAAGQVTLRAVRLTEALSIDGSLDEGVYQTVPPITDLVQLEPQAGAPASEKTEAWLFFDDTSSYVMVRCWDSAPESEWVANEMRRDSFNILNNDNLSFVIDTFYDRRNGIIFNINPIGGRMDGQITNERDFNLDWNPIWNLQTGRFDGGWSFEAQIPFKSLRYRPGRTQLWGFQLSRTIPRLNESDYLTRLDQGLSRAAIAQVSQAATLVGVETPDSTGLFEIKPYVIGDVSSDLNASPAVSNQGNGNIGLDIVKYGITQNLTADFTLNTDFAQVEADEQQVNLTRFSLFFPEKREFFLENQGVFGFGGAGARGPFSGSAETPIMFYSRRIGLSGGREVPITAGGRLTGRAGKYTLGFLNIQTNDEPVSGAQSTNFTVARLTRDVLRRSAIGALLTSRSVSVSHPGSNQVYGVDGTFAFYDNVNINTFWARTQTNGVTGDDTSYKGELRYNGDRYGVTAEHLYIGESFSPEIGFIRRPDLRKSYGLARFSPRPTSINAIRKFSWEGSYNYITDAAGVVETREAQGVFGIEFETSDRFNLTYLRTFDFLKRPFEIAPEVTIPIGEYEFWNAQARMTFAQQRRVGGTLTVDHGSFYGGTKTVFGVGGGFGPAGGARIELTQQFSFEPGISFNWIDLPQGSFTTQLVTTRTTYTLTPAMFVSALIQYNSANNALSSNIRLRWEYQPGSELFVVYNEQRDTLTPERYPELQNRAFIIKFNRLFRF